MIGEIRQRPGPTGAARGWRAAALAAAAAAATGVAALSGCAAHHTVAVEAAEAARAHVSAMDRAWIDQIHQADLAEMEAGPLGADAGTTAAVRAAGAAITRDHTVFDAKLRQVAAKVGVPLPTHVTMQQTMIGDRLSKETGSSFDHDFTASMMTAHEHAITITHWEITRGTSPPVVALAKQALPMLEKHLAMLRAAAASG